MQRRGCIFLELPSDLCLRQNLPALPPVTSVLALEARRLCTFGYSYQLLTELVYKFVQ